MEGISVAQAALRSGLTPNQVSGLIFAGLIEPEFHVPDGSGDSSVLGEKNVRELVLIANLKKVGLKQETIRSVMNLLAESRLDWWKERDNHVVVTSDKWFVTNNVLGQIEELAKTESTLVLVKI